MKCNKQYTNKSNLIKSKLQYEDPHSMSTYLKVFLNNILYISKQIFRLPPFTPLGKYLEKLQAKDLIFMLFHADVISRHVRMSKQNFYLFLYPSIPLLFMCFSSPPLMFTYLVSFHFLPCSLFLFFLLALSFSNFYFSILFPPSFCFFIYSFFIFMFRFSLLSFERWSVT